MELKLNLELRQTQRLLLTPNLQQAIKLLQLSRLELVQTVREELEQNPMLEEVTSELSPETEEDGSPPEGEASLSEKEEAEEEKMADLASNLDWEDFFTDNVVEPDPSFLEQEKTSWESRTSKAPSLMEHLLWQLRLSTSTLEEQKIGNLIIGNIDEDGYLRASTEEIAESADNTKSEVERALGIIQTFEPSGIGARDLKECLLIQVKDNSGNTPFLRKIILHHLKNLEKKKYQAIAHDLGITPNNVLELAQIISTYNPKPGLQFTSSEVRYVVPDVFVYKLDNNYIVTLNEDGVPRLRISQVYKNLLRKGNSNPENAKEYLDKKLRSAIWLIRSIQQRQITLYKVTESIVRFQSKFLDHGIAYLKPLTLKDVAQDVSMHESTISRVTTSKYVHTPQGIFELKYFFHSGLSSCNGGDISSLRIKDMIKKLVAEEDRFSPLTDIQLRSIMQQRGISIARRTITKYREAMRISPSNQRRQPEFTNHQR